ncbi:unnamed protein product [Caenorhabditis angaria]|uniref:Protein sleepless n=1 Tax=Caenorhabditis angaria TaxID=860376 RepID=A0A9P1IQA6_9PELO|nr:unnamed protein product [Caenorhabditis angaria]
MFYLIFSLLLISIIDKSEQVQCYGGDQEVGGTQNEDFVDYNCPSLWSCFILIQQRKLAGSGENGTMLVMRKGCVEKAVEVDFDGAPSCFNFDFTNSSSEIFSNDFRCTCSKDFCNGGDEPSSANSIFGFFGCLLISVVINF